MRIGIDARLINETGVGRYIRNLIDELARIDKINSYVVFVRDDAWKPPKGRWKRRIIDVPWHSVSEQLVMPRVLVGEHLDLVHIPYFNAPIFYPGKFVVTIHDLTILHFDTGKASTLPLPMYALRRFGYYLALAVGLRRADQVIAVSNTTKHEIMDHFQIQPEKITVTYEGVDKKFKSEKLKVKSGTRIIKEPYLLYVGNAYPHKNLETLLKAFQKLISQGTPLPGKGVPCKTKLVLVGKDDFFYLRLRKTVTAMGLADWVIFFGSASEEQLFNLYRHAVALVFPSLMEGFGLPALEAIAIGTPVVCSDIPVFHEIYGDSAVYFDPKSPEDMISKFKTVMSDKMLQKDLMQRGKSQVAQYSWKKLAQQTLAAYNGN